MKIPSFIANHKLATLICALLIVGVPTGYALKARGGDIKYLTSPVTRGNITAVVQATGVINPLTTVPVRIIGTQGSRYISRITTRV